ncbi:MAG: L7Ae/L30e/S12e/Gadd45 family ribosomal protein [Candidatus Thermoplasmatota archaeon]|nr:L7Ae/L30e/S12e/Gadd45 family ribosomal protein [Candidatus Thermoplasmatota archaeon]HII26220.1 50S ribosomal protein L7ae [Candidatus Thalassarchaeaceae archaeon]HII28770.1 50S ribosomal protein L7ae [Candidatus Thalassarchaeaceae archaeon]
MSVHIAFETPKDIQEQVYELVKAIGKDGRGKIKKGANEVTKAAERGIASMIVMAENVNPGELLAHVPMICKEKGIPFIYVEDQGYLADSAGMTAGTRTAAVAVLDVDKEAQDIFNEVKGHYETLAK